MLAAVVRRGDFRFPTVIEDDFNRVNSTDLGRTPVGNVPWELLTDGWQVRDQRLVVPSGTNPLAVVDARRSDVSVDLFIGTTSSDGIAFRVKDSDNFLRVSNYYQRTTQNTYITESYYICVTSPVKVGINPWHSHDRGCWGVTNCCTRTLHNHDPYGSHGNEIAIPQSETRQVLSGTTSTTTRRVYLEQIENGTRTVLDYWTVPSVSQLRVVASGSTISVSRHVSGTWEEFGLSSSTFNLNETRHGVSHSTAQAGLRGTVDNFSLTTLN